MLDGEGEVVFRRSQEVKISVILSANQNQNFVNVAFLKVCQNKKRVSLK